MEHGEDLVRKNGLNGLQHLPLKPRLSKRSIQLLTMWLTGVASIVCTAMVCGCRLPSVAGTSDTSGWMGVHFIVQDVGPNFDSSAFVFYVRFPDGSTRESRCFDYIKRGYEIVVLHDDEEQSMHGGDVFVSVGYPVGDSMHVAMLDTLTVNTVTAHGFLHRSGVAIWNVGTISEQYTKRVELSFGQHRDTLLYDVAINSK